MAEHDSKTPTDVGAAALQRHAAVSMIAVVHMLGGQVVIGTIKGTMAQGASLNLEHPYEVFAIPNPDSTEVNITLVKYGTMLGCMPEIGVNEFMLIGTQVVKYVPAPSKLIQAYYAALQQELNPVTKEQVAAAITPGKAQP